MARPVSKSSKAKPKGALRPFTFLGVTALVFWGSYIVYRQFQVADAEGWLRDVASVLAVVAIAIVAAGVAAAAVIALRRNRKRDNIF